MEKFREFTTSSGKKVLGGKTAESNEQLIKQVENNEIVLHTKSPGSPFVNIKPEKGSKISQKDIRESAIFCARYSKAWKSQKSKKDVAVHYFKGKDIFKDKKMKSGTFGVKKYKEIIVRKQDIEGFDKNE